MKRLALHLLAGVFAPAVVWSATITWNAPCPITAESDVVNTGTTVYAYSCYVWGGTYKINDVYFTPWGSHPNDDKVQFGIDADLQGAAASQKVAEEITNIVAGVTWTYYKTLSQVAASEKAGSTMTLRLKRLVPGRRYLVQFWCNTSGDVDYTNQVTTIDGTVALRGSISTNTPGQHVTGTFTANATYQDIVFTPEKSEYRAVFNMFQVRALDAAAIAWDEPQQITDANDIRADGQLVYAYAHSGTDYTFGGTTFRSNAAWTNCFPELPSNSFAMSDVATRWRYYVYDSFIKDDLLAASDYNKMLKGAMYVDQDKSATLYLRRLQVGHTYLIQLWATDAREEALKKGWRYRTLSVAGSKPIYYGSDDSGLGHYITGTFVATTPEVALELVPGLVPPEGKTYTCQSSAQWNAIQLRDITSDIVVWEVPRQITGNAEQDVDSIGTSYYAWHGGTNDVDYGGVTFRARHREPNPIQSRIVEEANRDIYYPVGCTKTVSGMVPTVSTENGWKHPEVLLELLGSVCWSSQGSPWSVELRRLVPGRRYRVQFFWADTRNDITRQDFFVESGPRVPVNDSRTASSAGWCITGEFRALAPTRTLLVSTMNGGAPAIHFQAIQVRDCTGDGAAVTYSDQLIKGSAALAKDESDVITDGTLLEARSGIATEVNGVAFTKPTNTKWGDSTYFALPSGFKFAEGVSGTYVPNPATPYETFLAAGYYRDNYNPFTLTLRNLVAGHRYKVQLWQCDTRFGFSNRWSNVDFCGGTPYFGQGKGWWASANFVALSNTWPLVIRSKNLQVNAIQLRDCGKSDVPVWSGEYALAVNTALPGNVFAQDNLTVTGPGTVALTGAFVGGDCTLATPWAGTTLLRDSAGRTTLTVAPTESQAVVVNNGGVIAIGPSVTVAATALAGNGTLAGPGVLNYAFSGMASFDGTLAEGVSVNATGGGIWYLSGAQNGEAAIVSDGTVHFTGGTYAGTFRLEAAPTVAFSGVTCIDGAALTLEGATTLEARGTSDVANLFLHVAEPLNYVQRKNAATPAAIFVYDPAETATPPRIVFDQGGFTATTVDLNDGRKAIYALIRRGMVMYLR